MPAALLTSAYALSHDSLRLVLARAEFEKVVDLRQIATACGRGRPGSAAVHAALAAHLPQLARCESPLEIDFVLLCERLEVPLPEPNARVGRWRPDMLWAEQRLVVELDGKDAHSTASQLISDTAREEALVALGFRVLRFTWNDVRLRPGWVAAEVLAALTQ